MHLHSGQKIPAWICNYTTYAAICTELLVHAVGQGVNVFLPIQYDINAKKAYKRTLLH